MKYVLIAAIAVVVILAIAQLYFTFSLSNVETHHYTVLSQKGNIEIRKYDPAVFISYSESGSMFETQNSAFRNLAGYIFGDNAREQKIAMTAPVQMEQKGEEAVMRFMIPSEYEMSELPQPDNGKVLMSKEPGFRAAVIRYGGFNSAKKFKKHKELLNAFITKENLQPAGEFIYFGYNPPFQWFGRKNEVMVKIKK